MNEECFFIHGERNAVGFCISVNPHLSGYVPKNRKSGKFMQQLEYTHAAKKLPVSLLFLCSRTRCRLPFLLAKKFRAPIRTQPCWNPHGTQCSDTDDLKTFLIGDLSPPYFFNRQ